MIRWAYEGLSVNEFTGLQITQDSSPLAVQGESVLQTMGLTHTVGQTLKAQLGIAFFNYALTCLVLMWQNPKKGSVNIAKVFRNPNKDVAKETDEDSAINTPSAKVSASSTTVEPIRGQVLLTLHQFFFN